MMKVAAKIKDRIYSCTTELSAEIIMFIIIFILAAFICSIYMAIAIPRFAKNNKLLRNLLRNPFLSSAYAFFLPLMSYKFSIAQQYNQELTAQAILIWMVSIEIIRICGDPLFIWKLRKSMRQLARLLWVSIIVYSYTPLQGIRVSLLVLCVFFAVYVVCKGITFNRAKDSYLIGKNPKLIHGYVKRIIHQDDLQTTPINSCDYIVMGEEDHEIAVVSNGYYLGKKKSNCKGILTVGRVFQLNSSEDEAFTSRFPYWRETCLSLALAKMLMRRFAKLPVDEAGCRKALDFVLEGLIDYIGSNRDIQTDGNNGERNPTERVFSIMQEELKFVSDFLYIEVPTNDFSREGRIINLITGFIVGCIGVYLSYTINNNLTAWQSAVTQEADNYCFFHVLRRDSVMEIFSTFDGYITSLLIIAFMVIQVMRIRPGSRTIRWWNIEWVKMFIKSPANWNFSLAASRYSTLTFHLDNYLLGEQRQNAKQARGYSSILDAQAETIFFCIKVDVAILARLPKWIRRRIPRSYPTVVHSTDAKEVILRSLRKSGGQLTSGESSLKKYGMEHLNWACQPNGSTTETILVWHIATTLFNHMKPAPQQNNDPFKEQEVALTLSNYCLYLVSYLPELLPDEVEWTEKMYESVIKEILAMDQNFTKNDCCNYTLQAMWVENSVVGKGAIIAKDLMKGSEHETQKWEMLAEFWAEIMLFIAPSDNVEGHQHNLNRLELITQLWALLTHAGIVSRPKPTEQQQHESHNNPVTGDLNV